MERYVIREATLENGNATSEGYFFERLNHLGDVSPESFVLAEAGKWREFLESITIADEKVAFVILDYPRCEVAICDVADLKRTEVELFKTGTLVYRRFDSELAYYYLGIDEQIGFSNAVPVIGGATSHMEPPLPTFGN